MSSLLVIVATSVLLTSAGIPLSVRPSPESPPPHHHHHHHHPLLRCAVREQTYQETMWPVPSRAILADISLLPLGSHPGGGGGGRPERAYLGAKRTKRDQEGGGAGRVVRSDQHVATGLLMMKKRWSCVLHYCSGDPARFRTNRHTHILTDTPSISILLDGSIAAPPAPIGPPPHVLPNPTLLFVWSARRKPK